ncbi:hypothetical protein [Nitrosopumilus sp.]|uniref:hypothetical protein n=1 Tax=Nitrosopumilus sp. TaxID=2024843 RepID=UPI003B59809E
MLEKILEKALEHNSFLGNRIQSLSESRKNELELMKSKIRTSPQEVEEWFEKEIAKISNLNGSSSSLKDTINMTVKQSEDPNQ